MRARHIIFTGCLGWFGGIATLAAVSSCDQDTCMDDADGCDDLTTRDGDMRDPVRIKVPAPPPPPITSEPAGTCDMMARPSVHVYVAREFDDYMQHVPVDAVWFEWRGQAYEAMCIHESAGDECNSWIAGWEKDGRIEIFTEYCDAVWSVVVDVEMAGDLCHLETEYVVLPVGTRGCITTNPPPAPPPPEQERV